jgi:TRAP transporter TAXI family solute receptor
LSESWKEFLRIGIASLLLAAAAFALAWHFVQPAPPKHVIIASGPKEGVYYRVAKKYAEYFASDGIDLQVIETGGSVDNLKLLGDPASGVDAAIVQAGTATAADREHGRIQSVAGIYYEPVLVFYRGEPQITQLPQLKGKKIAIGAAGSGVRVIAQLLLDEAGVADGTADTHFVDDRNDAAADDLVQGNVDAAFFVISPDAPVVIRLLGTPGIRLMSFDHAHAYGRRHPFLSATTLYKGAVDIRQNLPEADVQLVAAPATIVVRDTTHPGIIQLLVRAAQQNNSGATLLSDPGTFPSAERSDLPVNKDALYFLNNKPSILQRTLPFWLASLIDRMIIMIVPLLVVLVPLIRMAPQLYKWRIDNRLLHRYKRVRHIEEQLQANPDSPSASAGVTELRKMEADLAMLKLPTSYAEKLYNLRRHIAYVRGRFEKTEQPSSAI